MMDFPLILETDTERPLYLRLHAALEEAIVDGRLQGGEKLPSTRDLSQSLGLSRGTVERAYEMLLGTGLVEARVGLGTVVRVCSKRTKRKAKKSPEKGRGDTDPEIADSPLALSSWGSRLMALNRSAEGALHADQDPALAGAIPLHELPTRIWYNLLLAQVRERRAGLGAVETDPFGPQLLRQALARYLSQAKGVRCTSGQVIIFSGNQQGLHQILSLLIDPGEYVVLEDPVYPGVRQNMLAHGAKITPLAVDAQGIKVETLSQLPPQRLIYVTPGGQEPLGMSLSEERAETLLDWAQVNNTVIIEEAWDTDYRYGQPVMSALQGRRSPKTGPVIIYFYPLWKLLFPLATLTAVVVPLSLIPLFRRARLLTERSTATMDQLALADFIAGGHLQLHLRKNQKLQREKRQTLIASISKYWRSLVHFPLGSAGLHLIVRFKNNRGEREILRAAARVKMPLFSTVSYYAGQAPVLEFILPFAAFKPVQIEAMVQEFGRLLRD